MVQVFKVTQTDITITAKVEHQNRCLIQLIGDVPHYGVVTTVDTTGNLRTTALPSRPGHVHQEGVLTELMATELNPVLQSNCMIVSGVHVNSITPIQMKATGAIVCELTAQVRKWLDEHPREKINEQFSR